MKYIGSGVLGRLIAERQADAETGDVVIWGRRARRVRPADLREVIGRRVVYLDTVDPQSCRDRALRLRWRVTPYRLEKTFMYYFLCLFSESVVRVHVPAITDSATWRRLVVLEPERGLEVRCLRYEALIALLERMFASGKPSGRYRSVELFRLAREFGLAVDSILADRRNFSTRLLGAIA